MRRRLIRLDVYLAGVFDHVSVGKDPFTVDNNPGALYLLGTILAPRTKQVGGMVNRMYFHYQVADRVLGVRPGGQKNQNAESDKPGNGSIHRFSFFQCISSGPSYYTQSDAGVKRLDSVARFCLDSGSGRGVSVTWGGYDEDRVTSEFARPNLGGNDVVFGFAASNQTTGRMDRHPGSTPGMDESAA